MSSRTIGKEEETECGKTHFPPVEPEQPGRSVSVEAALAKLGEDLVQQTWNIILKIREAKEKGLTKKEVVEALGVPTARLFIDTINETYPK
jgi:hypothetical protein